MANHTCYMFDISIQANQFQWSPLATCIHLFVRFSLSILMCSKWTLICYSIYWITHHYFSNATFVLKRAFDLYYRKRVVLSWSRHYFHSIIPILNRCSIPLLCVLYFVFILLRDFCFDLFFVWLGFVLCLLCACISINCLDIGALHTMFNTHQNACYLQKREKN